MKIRPSIINLYRHRNPHVIFAFRHSCTLLEYHRVSSGSRHIHVTYANEIFGNSDKDDSLYGDGMKKFKESFNDKNRIEKRESTISFENLKNKLRRLKANVFGIDERDAHVRPTKEEIESRNLPRNTPTLFQRNNRKYQSYIMVAEEGGGYMEEGKTGSFRDYVNPDWTTKDFLKMSVTHGKEEFEILKHDYKEAMHNLHNVKVEYGDSLDYFKFQTDKDIKGWSVASDAVTGEGYSSCEFIKSPAGNALFKGYLDTRVPQDGFTYQAGFVGIRSPRRRKAGTLSDKAIPHIVDYTHIYLIVRGDGRSYKLSLRPMVENWATQFCLYSYPLHTRGGPYWQHVKIPFTKFIEAEKGKVRKTFQPIDREDITSVYINLEDCIDGPFQLEIKEIGFYRDAERFTEKNPYETYVMPHKRMDSWS